MKYVLMLGALLLSGCISLADEDRRRVDEITAEMRVLNSRLRESDETLRKLTTAMEALKAIKR